MNKKSLLKAIAKNRAGNGISKKAMTGIIGDTLAAAAKWVEKIGRFSFPGFGTFTMKSRAARKGSNPQTDETIMIKASRAVKSKTGPALKKDLSSGKEFI
ncbi:MAG: HU family DNA-binding protein (plasmid) [Candidatus Manganitrophus sp.]|jgi:DNA-binding protein HU-beta|nr:HU family DNA-binding protein [Candidatus Manganitrophus sp.]MDC4228227.1 HU family DNA-binding protein [Candidatus Manganitrophus sp.]WDT73701.1 MAG: HU family DNA-binding protein [Candidatus Manganitrophus sp.]WDT77794.1 MAG: HU family DNA-binding protein [Candidatus Manganitrophus sp.]